MSPSSHQSRERRNHSCRRSRHRRHSSRSSDSQDSDHRSSKHYRERSPHTCEIPDTKFNYKESSFPSLIINNLPSNVTKDDLIKSLLEVRATYKKVLPSQGEAIIEFHTFIEATRFLELTRGRVTVAGHSVNVRHLTSSELRTYYGENSGDNFRRVHIEESEPCNVLILRGLDECTSEEDVRNAVCHLTEKIVYDVRLIKDKITNVSRGFCFIELGSVEDAAFLLYMIKNMIPPFAIHGRHIGVGYAKNNFGFSCNARVNNNSVASNAIAAARAASSALPQNLQDSKPVTQNTQSLSCGIPGDPQQYVFDPSTGYYVDPTTGLYHDRTTGTFYNPYTQEFLYFNQLTNSLIPFSRHTENIGVKSEKAESNSSKEKPVKPTPTLSKAEKISQDVDSWAKRVNTKTACKMTIKKQRIQQVQEKQKRAVELKDKIDAQELFQTLSSAPVKTSDANDRLLLDQTLESDPHLSVPDLACLLCQRKFPTKEILIKHVTSSSLHSTNLEKASQTLNP